MTTQRIMGSFRTSARWRRRRSNRLMRVHTYLALGAIHPLHTTVLPLRDNLVQLTDDGFNLGALLRVPLLRCQIGTILPPGKSFT